MELFIVGKVVGVPDVKPLVPFKSLALCGGCCDGAEGCLREDQAEGGEGSSERQGGGGLPCREGGEKGRDFVTAPVEEDQGVGVWVLVSVGLERGEVDCGA